MIRALIELVFAIVVLIAARAILGTVLKGLLTLNSSVTRQSTAPPPADTPPGRELHKDPVCGTYVVESTPYRRQIGPTVFYFCSEQCLQTHTVGARR